MKKEIIKAVIEQARKTTNENIGVPFGAPLLMQNGTILSITSNSVLGDHDPTAHAEINAAREACKVKGTHHLTGCVIHATAILVQCVYQLS